MPLIFETYIETKWSNFVLELEFCCSFIKLFTEEPSKLGKLCLGAESPCDLKTILMFDVATIRIHMVDNQEAIIRNH